MLSAALLICHKDLRLCLGRGSALVHALLLGLLLIFIFSLSLGVGERMSARGAAAIFWMSSAFCQVLIFSALYALEETNGQRQGLLLAPMPIQAVWLGKAITGFCLLGAAQLLFFPAILVFLGQEVSSQWPQGLGIVLMVNIGSVTLGSLLGALSQGQSAKESLLSIIIFPLLVPLFLAGITIGATVFSGNILPDVSSWFGLVGAFDAVFVSAALFLFPFMYTAE